MNKQIDKQNDDEVPSNYVTTARISEIRKKMLHGSIKGSPEQLAVAAEIWHRDLPDLLETLERTQRGDFKQKPAELGCIAAVLIALAGGLIAVMAVMGAMNEADTLLTNVKQEAAQRCAELGGTYADGGAKIGERTIYCIPRAGTPAQPTLPSNP